MKQFSLADQRRFAALSGDYNPLHLDPVYSRRLLFGGPVVHGVHLVLYALDKMLAGYTTPKTLKSLKAVFSYPMPLEKPFEVEIITANEEEFEIRAKGNQCYLHGSFFAENTDNYWDIKLPDNSSPGQCKELSFNQAVSTQGATPLYINLAELQAMFPSLAKKIPPVQVAELLATTRLTGMDCPGLHTIFHSFDLYFERNDLPLNLEYHVSQSDERFSRMQLAVQGYGVQGELCIFFRPGPVEQPSIATVAEKVKRGEFEHVHALIVGGSRGLGEVAAKIIAAGGGDVRITYNLGKTDAERVVDEITGFPGKCRCFHYDVLSSEPLPELLENWLPTHLLYFATPYFGSAYSKDSYYSELFNQQMDYLMDFSRLLESLFPLIPGGLKVFYPSTAFINSPGKGRKEFVDIKEAGELMCQRYVDKHPNIKFYIPRLPRLKTDQTASVSPSRMADSLDVILEAIRRMETE